MFLAGLDDDSKDAFLALAANVAPPLDTDLHETPLWREWLAEMRMPERTRIGWHDAYAAARHIKTPDDRTSIMLELARLAIQAAEEPETLSSYARIGGLLGFAAHDIDAFLNWAQRHAAVVAEATRIGELRP